ncbi:hypothetical protein BH23ACT2_BH23ACT2_07300 [soil metagenome]
MTILDIVNLHLVAIPELTDDRDEILARVDLADLFTSLGLVGKGSGFTATWRCPNPHHAQTGDTPPVAIGRDHKATLWNCHACEAGGTAIDLLRYAQGLDIAAAFARLRDRTGITAGTPAPRRPTPAPKPPPPLPDPRQHRDDSTDADDALRSYLAWRHWPDEAVDRFDLYVVRDRQGRPWVRHPYRVGGAIKWWQDRAAFTGAAHKWDNPSGHKGLPYAHDLCAALEDAEHCGSVFIVEGPGDTITLDLAGFTTIGIPGTANPARWAQMLAGVGVYIALDADEAGDTPAHPSALTSTQCGTMRRDGLIDPGIPSSLHRGTPRRRRRRSSTLTTR